MMQTFFSPKSIFRRSCAATLAILHLLTFGPIRDAFAYSAQSATYRLNPAVPTQGGAGRTTATYAFTQDSLAEPAVGQSQSEHYRLNSGYILMLGTRPPQQTQTIPNFSWDEGNARLDAFDLDDYFTSPDSMALTYTASGNHSIIVTMDPASHRVSFTQPQGWYGIEKVTFTATDTDLNTAVSNQVALQVRGLSNPPVLDYIPDIMANEATLVTIIPYASDLDGGTITYSFTAPLNSQGQWQTDYDDAGLYTVIATARDQSGLTDTQPVHINIRNVNRPPVLAPIENKTIHEGDIIYLTPVATDPDGDALTFYYSYPLDVTGWWFTGYDDAGTYSVTVTCSDGVDTVRQSFTLTVLNTNRAPQAELTLGVYTVKPNEDVVVALSASDPDADEMTFVLKKDGETIASGNISFVFSTTVSFATVGDHTVSAEVTDAGGLTATASAAIDVIDPNANNYYIQPLMGDFNGDGLSDVGLHDAATGKWEVSISNGGVFRAAADWLANFGTSPDWWPMGGDFNGDAKTDVAIYYHYTGELQVALSSGNSFSPAGTWLAAGSADANWQPFTGNFNADRFTDIGLYYKYTGEVKVALGNGSGFGAFTVWHANFGTYAVAMSADFNGDSLSDLCLFNKAGGEWKVAFSNTESFVDGAVWLSGFAADKDALVSDFNNDGLADAGYWDASLGNWYYATSTGSTFVDKGVWQVFGTSAHESATTGDFNGDGITDAACFDREALGINRWSSLLSNRRPADLLTSIDNGIGGKTLVTYAYASQFDNGQVPFPVYVASSITLVDTVPASAPQERYTQQFSFYGGYFDAFEREFRGFSRVRVTDPITGNYTETYFLQGVGQQDGALKGQIEKVLAFDGNNHQISQTVNTYEVRKAGPELNTVAFPSLKETHTTVWEENRTVITTKSDFAYDTVGNVITQHDDGDLTVTGDEKTVHTTYALAYTAGFNRPLGVTVLDKDENVLSQKFFSYDARGNLTQERLPIHNPLTQQTTEAVTTYSYDSFGNLTSTVNARGYTVTSEYERDYYAFPQKITNSLGHEVSYVYEPKLGAVLSTTDTNGAISAVTYDTFGRIVQARNALNEITSTYAYPNFNTKVTTQGGLSKSEYVDGLGRMYQAVSQGEDGDALRYVSSEVYYNNRGQVSVESAPHYVDEDGSQISYARYEYDLRGRVKKTIADFPGTLKDAASEVLYIEPLYTETIDPQGHRKGARKDIFGNVLEVTEFTQGGVYKTKYEYDLKGNLIKVTDALGNVSTMTFDSIGRKLAMSDPDMGSWTYEYDIMGNLLRQTDARGEILTFEYDVLNRLTSKTGTVPGSQGTVPVLLATYLYDDPLKLHCIGRLSKVTDQSGSTEFFYDILGREIKSIKGLSPQGTVPAQSYTVERTYDTLDRLLTLKYPDGEVVTYTYDTNSGLLEKVTGTVPASQGTVPYVAGITYSASGQMKQLTYGNGVVTNYTYGQDQRLSRILTQNPVPGSSNPALQDLNYLFDKNGNVTTLTDNLKGVVRSFMYDDLDRLTEARNAPAPGGGLTTYTFQYDAIGNMTYKSDVGVMRYGVTLPGGGVSKPHAVTLAGSTSYAYDANGNMTQRGSQTLAYDAENRLLSVSDSATITSYTYDGDGGRVVKWTVPVSQGTVPATTTVYIGSLFEIQATGNGEQGTVKHIFAGATRIASVSLRAPEGGEAISYYHTDHLGSSSAITDSTGALVQSIEYAPYGAVTRGLSPQGTVPEGSPRHLFTGKELDSTGLYFYGARYYDPTIGRFITADSIVQAPYDPQSLNRYTYCRNNPINYVDPTGHFAWFVPIIIAAVVGGTLGGISAGMNGLPIWQGILMGAVGGALTAAGGMGFGFWGAVAGGAFSGAANSAVFGGNIGIGALTGGLGAGLGFGLGSLAGSNHLLGLGASMLAGGIASGVGAELSGGDFWQGAGMGAAFAAAGYCAGYGLSKAVNSSNTNSQKTTRQLKTDQSPEFGNVRLWKTGETGNELVGTYDSKGNFHDVPKIPAGRRITVLGSKDDLIGFQNNSRYNVLDPSIPITPQQNFQFIKSAVQNGDYFMFMRNPVAWNEYTTSVYGKPSNLLLEQHWVQDMGASDSRIIRMYDQ